LRAVYFFVLFCCRRHPERTWPPRSYGMGSPRPFCFPPFQMFDFAETIRVEITLYRRTPHAFVQTMYTHTHTHINLYNIYKADTSGRTINNKTIYEETVKYFRIYLREAFSKTRSSLNAQWNACLKDIYINNMIFSFLAFVFLRTHGTDDGVVIMVSLRTVSNHDCYRFLMRQKRKTRNRFLFFF